jgi:flagellar basal body rod protein FlgG
MLVHSRATSDLFVVGSGFFVAQDPDENLMLVKGGELGVNELLQLTIKASGAERVLCPPVAIPSDSTHIRVNMIGEVSVTTRSNPREFELCGQLACGLITDSMLSELNNSWLQPKFGFEQTTFGLESESIAISGWKFMISP